MNPRICCAALYSCGFSPTFLGQFTLSWRLSLIHPAPSRSSEPCRAGSSRRGTNQAPRQSSASQGRGSPATRATNAYRPQPSARSEAEVSLQAPADKGTHACKGQGGCKTSDASCEAKTPVKAKAVAPLTAASPSRGEGLAVQRLAG
jgi:hypothetical protein